MFFRCCKRKNKSDIKKETEFWIISLPPGDGLSPEKTYHQLIKLTKKCSRGFVFKIPKLKITTLNQLIALSDELAKTDALVESVVKKIGSYIHEILFTRPALIVKSMKINNLHMAEYITKFSWDEPKFPATQTMGTTCDLITGRAEQIDKAFKAKSAYYNEIISKVENAERKLGGDLLTRDMEYLVKPHHFVKDSAYLTSYVIIVEKSKLDEWKNSYESFSKMVVPRSSKILYRDDHHFVCNVTIFKTDANAFKQKARERKFVVRDYRFDLAGNYDNPQNMLDSLKQRMKLALVPTIQFMSSSFYEMFVSWIHIKAMRVFTESILKYGISVHSVSAVLIPHLKKDRQLSQILYNKYAVIDPEAYRNPKLNVRLPGFAMPVGLDYTPFVCFKFNTKIHTATNK